MFIDLSNLQGKLALAITSFIFSCIFITLSKKHLPKFLSDGLKMKIFVFSQEFIILTVYLFKYAQVGFDFAPTHYYWQVYGLIICAMGYLAHLVLTIYHNLHCKPEIIHHCISIGMIYVCIAGDYVQLGNLTNFMFQLSHPGYAFRLLLKELDRKNNLIYELNEVYYFLSYIILRPIGGLYLLYRLVHTEGTEVCIVLSVMMWFYVAYFGFRMMPALRGICRKIQERRRRGIKYYWFEENPVAKTLSFYHAKDI